MHPMIKKKSRSPIVKGLKSQNRGEPRLPQPFNPQLYPKATKVAMIYHEQTIIGYEDIQSTEARSKNQD